MSPIPSPVSVTAPPSSVPMKDHVPSWVLIVAILGALFAIAALVVLVSWIYRRVLSKDKKDLDNEASQTTTIQLEKQHEKNGQVGEKLDDAAILGYLPQASANRERWGSKEEKRRESGGMSVSSLDLSETETVAEFARGETRDGPLPMVMNYS
ncbi:hypothetical protein BKA70DRAFT_1562364, partial [Coprinopsis sp. MPI-PUGE-AT-0042]